MLSIYCFGSVGILASSGVKIAHDSTADRVTSHEVQGHMEQGVGEENQGPEVLARTAVLEA